MFLVSFLFSDMGCVSMWLVCVCALHMCVEAHSPQLGKSDHDHLDHRHHHLVSDDKTASGITRSASVCVVLSCQFSSTTHHLFNLCAHKHNIALPGAAVVC